MAALKCRLTNKSASRCLAISGRWGNGTKLSAFRVSVTFNPAPVNQSRSSCARSSVYCFSCLRLSLLPGSLPPWPGSRQTLKIGTFTVFFGGNNTGCTVVCKSSSEINTAPLRKATGAERYTVTPLIPALCESTVKSSFDQGLANCTSSFLRVQNI